MDPAEESLRQAGELRLVVGRLLRRMRSERGFPLGQAAVLNRLDREGATSIGALATAEGVRPQSMAQLVTELERIGLTSRSTDPADGRRVLVALTPAGNAALVEERRERDGWLATALERECSATERRALDRVLPALGRIAELPPS
ncbi:MAG: MarR family transcriptional regulator [Thermoleophilia bacterium]|nr:MarR family transcriptional regulator [Thermoleophilia bacterium]